MKKIFVISVTFILALLVANVATATAPRIMLDDVARPKDDGTAYTVPEAIEYFATDQKIGRQVIKFTQEHNSEVDIRQVGTPGRFLVVDVIELEGDLTYKSSGTYQGHLVQETRTPDGQPRKFKPGQKVIIDTETGIVVMLADCLNPVVSPARWRKPEEEFTASEPRLRVVKRETEKEEEFTASEPPRVPRIGSRVDSQDDLRFVSNDDSRTSSSASANVTVLPSGQAPAPGGSGCDECGPAPTKAKLYRLWIDCVKSVCGSGEGSQTGNGQGGQVTYKYVDQTAKWNNAFRSMFQSRDSNTVDASYTEAPFNRVSIVRYGDRKFIDGRQYYWNNHRWVRVSHDDDDGGPSDTDPGEGGGPGDTDPGQGGWDGPSDTDPGQRRGGGYIPQVRRGNPMITVPSGRENRRR